MIKKSLRAYITGSQFILFILANSKVFRLVLFQFFKKLVHGIFEVFVILAGFAGVDELQQGGEVLLLLRGLIPDIANQCTVEQPFRFDPEILAGFFAIPLCVGDNGIDQFQNILSLRM